MNKENNDIKRETVVVKKTLIQGVEKQPGDKIDVTPEQKAQLKKSGHIN